MSYSIISLIFYLFFLHQTWHLCQYGGVRRHLLFLVITGLGFLISFIFWLFARRQKQKDISEQKMKKRIFQIEIIIAFIGTVYFGGRIVYSAIPYNGALSWKVDEFRRKKKLVSSTITSLKMVQKVSWKILMKHFHFQKNSIL